jgi:hypothetical protein
MYVVVTNDLVFFHFSICPLKTLHAQRHSPAEIDMYSEVKKLSCFCPFNFSLHNCVDVQHAHSKRMPLPKTSLLRTVSIRLWKLKAKRMLRWDWNC